MKNKRVLAALLIAAMTVGLTACGGSSDSNGSAAGTETGSTKADGDYEQVTYAYSTFNNIPTEEDLDVVEEEINKITREKIGVEVTLEPIAFADYPSKVSLALQGGEKIDIYESLGDFNNYVSTDMTYELNDLLDQYGQGIVDAIGEDWLAACTADGTIYGTPTLKPIALTPMVIYRQDIADELGLDMSSVNSIEDVTDILKQVKEAYPDMIPLAPVEPGRIGLDVTWGDVDFLTDSMYSPTGVLMGDDLTVTDLYSTDIYKERCELVRSWYNDGLVMQDAATTTSAAAETMSSGNYFCYIAAYSYPEAAMKFLNLTYTDADVINLLIYGIEGRDYVKNDDGTVSYPEGEDSTTVPYTAQLSCGTLGNYFLMYCLEGSDPASLDWELEQNKIAKTSPAMGFTFDSSSVKTQYTAVNNVIKQYMPGLNCGSLDPNTEIEKFVKALDDAGYQDILNAKQEQLDAWVAQQK